MTAQPTNQTFNVGDTATFTAAARGNPAPTMQWLVSSDGGSTRSDITGVTSTTLTLPSVTLAFRPQHALITHAAGDFLLVEVFQ